MFNSSIEVVLHNLRQFLEKSFDGKSIGADLTKIVKIFTILNSAKKMVKLFLQSSKKVVLHNFRRKARTLQK